MLSNMNQEFSRYLCLSSVKTDCKVKAEGNVKDESDVKLESDVKTNGNVNTLQPVFIVHQASK